MHTVQSITLAPAEKLFVQQQQFLISALDFFRGLVLALFALSASWRFFAPPSASESVSGSFDEISSAGVSSTAVVAAGVSLTMSTAALAVWGTVLVGGTLPVTVLGGDTTFTFLAATKGLSEESESESESEPDEDVESEPEPESDAASLFLFFFFFFFSAFFLAAAALVAPLLRIYLRTVRFGMRLQ